MLPQVYPTKAAGRAYNSQKQTGQIWSHTKNSQQLLSAFACYCSLSLLYFRHYWLLFWSKYIQYILLQRVLCEKQHICRGIGQVITVQFVGPKVGSFENHQQNMRKITKNKCNSIGNWVKELLVASSSIFVQIKPFLQGNQKRQI